MIKLAKILQINPANIVLEITQDSPMCTGCKSQCSKNLLGFLFKKNNKLIVSKTIESIEPVHLIDTDSFFNGANKINDVIGLKFDENQLFKFSLLLYGMPILLLVILSVLGHLLFTWLNMNQDIGAFLGLFFGFILSKMIVNIFQARLKPHVSFFQ